MADHAKYEGQLPQNVVDAIKQKHFRDLDVDDIQYLRDHQDLLSDADKKIFLEGENPYEATQEHTPLTRNERIINENRPLQESNQAIEDARNEATKGLNGSQAAQMDVVHDEELNEERERKMEGLAESADAVASGESEDDSKPAKKSAKK